MQYKWIALSNTTIGVLMASINGTITLISLPAIFRGININPFASFQYLLWILMGYNVVTATLLVTFGRLSDIFGRVRLYNLGFLIFTVGSILLSITPNTGSLGALELIIFRIIQGIGGAFLFSNSAAIITDAFPFNERGKALGINQIAALAGSLIGLILGGILSVINWRLVFLVSVPVGIAGTIWSYTKLKELNKPSRNEGLDWLGNTTFGLGLILVLVAITYGLLPYGSSQLGWGNPFVIGSLIAGLALIGSFIYVETKVKFPMFRLELFKVRMFAAGNFASFLRSVAYGGLQIMLIIFLQGIWLPLHGYSYAETPFWAGIYMIPLMIGFVTMGPISGWLSDKYGARVLATLGMIIVAVGFLLLTTLPYDFNYFEFALIIFFMGLGNGMFASPNTASIMNSVPPKYRGSASGMRATIQNTGQTMSIAIFFTIVIISLSSTLPLALANAVTQAGAPQLASYMQRIPVTGALFAAFLGYDPVKTIISSLPSQISSSIPAQAIAVMEQHTWFPTAIAPSFMLALREAFYISSILTFMAAIASALRGKVKIIDGEVNASNNK
ncbi:MFS transporter [Sulfolobus sp. A20]|uniref:MFS transporter n=1 Tax=Saccharolobus sp. A20 TaxID=1891280 RepID=UPI000845F584|nr:MFS transporter [Sulfolobus sp. A20]TRM76407.1 MFS transporter [Sulfolobus sp. E5]TRM76461.1 MFS transporter [Sulfolobus sp. B5]TRM82194.1 MFS transporter [Sulfolobus sp. D5]TRM89664.1 MFS transporter [Sulfolobus sp. C3]TRN02688.1 MFS transporter [Sulfolobus sp. E1]TRN03056.1 MFS transporter [Sulfolobus sp. F1]